MQSSLNPPASLSRGRGTRFGDLGYKMSRFGDRSSRGVCAVIMQKLQPIEIKRGTAGLTIRWKDSHLSELSYSLLRQKCPCARCKATRTGKNPLHILPSDVFFENLRLVDIQRVGRYAVRLVWNDGHRTGIYTFTFLRELGSS